MAEVIEFGIVAEQIRRGLADGSLRNDKHHRYECRFCFNCGFREVDDPQGGPNRGVVRCQECNYWFYRQKVQNYPSNTNAREYQP